MRCTLEQTISYILRTHLGPSKNIRQAFRSISHMPSAAPRWCAINRSGISIINNNPRLDNSMMLYVEVGAAACCIVLPDFALAICSHPINFIMTDGQRSTRSDQRGGFEILAKTAAFQEVRASDLEEAVYAWGSVSAAVSKDDPIHLHAHGGCVAYSRSISMSAAVSGSVCTKHFRNAANGFRWAP